MARTPPPGQLPVVDIDLDEQIALAEHAVIERDARIRRRSATLVRRVKHTALKNAGAGAVLGLGTAGLAWWLTRRRPGAAASHPRPEPEPAQASSTYEHVLRDAALAITGLMPVIWPMLPRGWRRNVTSGTASTVLTFFAPLVGRLFRRKSR